MVLYGNVGGVTVMDARVDHILSVVSRATEIEKKDILGRCSEETCIEARRIAMWLCREYGKLSNSEIMRIFNKKDLVTIIHGITVIERKMEADEGYKAYIDYLIKEITAAIPGGKQGD